MYIRYMSSDIFPYLRSVSMAVRTDPPAESSTCPSPGSWASEDVTFGPDSLSAADSPLSAQFIVVSFESMFTPVFWGVYKKIKKGQLRFSRGSCVKPKFMPS